MGELILLFRMSPTVDDQSVHVVPLARVEQILVASPSYLNQSAPISRPEDLKIMIYSDHDYEK
jgi:DNA-binding transcriptional LysR family regulator